MARRWNQGDVSVDDGRLQAWNARLNVQGKLSELLVVRSIAPSY